MTVEMSDEFRLDSGLRDDMVLTIHSAYFAPHADYMEGKALLLWLIGLDENEDAVDVRLSVGADWTTDDGNVVHHPTKKKQLVNKNSIYGHWLSYCFNIPELAKVLMERSHALSNKGPLDARIWIDMILHLETRAIEFGPKVPTQDRLMPIEYLGLTTDESPTIVSPTPAPPVQTGLSPQELVAQAQQRKAQEKAGLSNASPLYDRALSMAREASDFPSFLATALSDDEIVADDELAIQVADETQIWAQAQS